MRILRFRFALATLALSLSAGMVLAQSQPQNPLRPRSTPNAPAAEQPAAPAAANTETGANLCLDTDFHMRQASNESNSIFMCVCPRKMNVGR